MKLVLKVQSDSETNPIFTLDPAETGLATFGCDGSCSHVLSDDNAILPLHFQLRCEDDVWTIQNLDAESGIKFNEEDVGPDGITIEQDGEIEVGQTTITLTIDDGGEPEKEFSESEKKQAAASLLPIAAGVAVFAATAASQRTPADVIEFNRKKCHSGMVLLEGVNTNVSPSSVAWALAQSIPLYLIADFARLQMPLPEQLEKPTFLFNWMDDDVLPHCSPTIFSPEDPVDPFEIIDEFWGKDAMLCLFSKMDKNRMATHLRAALRRDDGKSTSVPNGILGYCWPEAGRAVLASAPTKMLTPLTKDVEAFLVEGEEPEQWQVYCDADNVGAIKRVLQK